MKSLLDQTKDRASVWHYLLFATGILIGFSLRAMSFRGFSLSDPYAYTMLAFDLSNGVIHIPHYDGPPVFPLRIGLYFPVALLFEAIGVSEYSIAAYPFIISMLTIILGYYLSRQIFGVSGGLITMVYLSLLPIDYQMSSLLYPDLIAAFWGNLGIFSLYMSLKRNTINHTSIAYGCASGLALGISWLCKETVVYLFPLCIVLVIFPIITRSRKLRLSTGLLMSITIGIIFIFEGIFLNYRTGEFLFRFHEIERNYAVCGQFFYSNVSSYNGHEFVLFLLRRLLFEASNAMLFNEYFNGIIIIALLSSILAWLLKLKEFVFPSLWLMSQIFIFIFGSSSLSSYMPLPLSYRYIYQILFPACLISGGFTSFAFARFVNTYGNSIKYTRVYLAFFALIFAAFIVASSYEFLKFRSTKSEYPAREAAKTLSKGDYIYTDSVTDEAISFFRTNRLIPDTFTKSYENISVTSFPKNSYVLVDRNRIAFLTRAYNRKCIPFENNPPSSWNLLWEKNRAFLYKVK